MSMRRGSVSTFYFVLSPECGDERTIFAASDNGVRGNYRCVCTRIIADIDDVFVVIIAL